MIMKPSCIYSQRFWVSVVGLIALAVFTESASVMSCNRPIICSTLPGARQPGNIINSRYFLLANGSVCCPPKKCEFSDDEIRERCGSRGTVNEPCRDCKTCGKLKGESCHGFELINRKCGPGLSCINENGTILESEYDEGVCTNAGGPPSNLAPSQPCGGKFGYLGTCESESRCNLEPGNNTGICVKYAKTNTIFSACGGPNGRYGRCIEGLHCAAAEYDGFSAFGDIGICVNADTDVAVCFKDCSRLAGIRVCGENGQWYENMCHLEQNNCYWNLRGRRIVRKAADMSICDNQTTATAATPTSAPPTSLM